MKSRFMIVLVSLVLAATATFGAAYYIAKLKSSVTEGQKLVDVVVANKPIVKGSSIAELSANDSIAVVRIPKQYVADDAIKSINKYRDKVIDTDLSRGDQVTLDRFKKAEKTGLTYKIPENMLAVTIAVDEVTGVGGQLQLGDRVDVIATASSGLGDEGKTKIMLQDIGIIAISGQDQEGKGNGFSGGQQPSSGKKTVTLEVYPFQAEKLVLASEKGHVWLGLRSSDMKGNIITPGQTIDSLFK